MYVVFDTNVLVSGLLSPKGPPAWLVELVLSQELSLVIDPRIWGEYDEVLRRPELKLPPAAVAIVLDAISANALHVTPRPFKNALPDPDDEPFIACAAEAGCSLVTGNTKHFPRHARGGIPFFTPREFFESLREKPRD